MRFSTRAVRAAGPSGGDTSRGLHSSRGPVTNKLFFGVEKWRVKLRVTVTNLVQGTRLQVITCNIVKEEQEQCKKHPIL